MARERARRERGFVVGAPVAIVLALAAAASLATAQSEARLSRLAFERRVDSLAWSLDREFQAYEEAVVSVAGYLRASGGEIDSARFRDLVGPVLARHAGLRALSWNPCVRGEDREAFEAAATHDLGRPFVIAEREGPDRLVRARARELYVCVRHIEPEARNAAALGFDVGSEPTRREALERAAATGSAAATGAIRLVQDASEPTGVLVFLPVFVGSDSPSSPEARRRSIRGYATGVLSIPEVVAAAAPREVREGIALRILDEGGPEARTVLHDEWGARPEGELRSARPRRVAGREWTFAFVPVEPGAISARTWLPWAVLATGVAIAGLLGACLLVITGKASRLEIANGELVEVHARLAASDARHRTFLEGMPAVAYAAPVVDPTRGSYTSLQIESLLGFPAEAWSADPDLWRDRLHPGDRERVLEALERAARDGRPFVEEYRVVARGGRVVWIRDAGSVVLDRTGRPLVFQGVRLDVSEAKGARARLEAEHAAALAITGSGSIEDVAGRILSVLGTSLEGDAATCWLVADGTTALQPFSIWISPDTTRDGPPRSFRFPIVSGDERFGDLEVLRREPAGPDQGLLLAGRSIGQQLGHFLARRRGEAALRESEERFRQMAENIREIFFLVDPGLTEFFYVSPGCERILGRSRETFEKNARAWIDCVHSDDRERVSRIALERGRAGEEHEQEYRLVRPDGSIRWVRSLVSPVRNGNGHVVRLAGIVEDLTAQKEAEAAHRALQAQLLQSQKMDAIGRLAGGVAHDFNNLLTAILGNACSILAKLRLEDPLREEAEEIRRAADRAAGLTRQLLAFSRKQVLAPRVVHLNPLVENMERMLRRLIGERIELEARLDPELRPVLVDPNQLEQVLLNLVVNARDAMPGGGRVAIETRWVLGAARPVRLVVSDTGCGMPPEVAARVFEPFFTTKEVGQGTGLGLSTVYGIVAQSGGEIAVESDPSSGTTFRIDLPAAEGAPAPSPEPGPDPESSGGETVLVVEDEESIRRLAVRILSRRGYRVLAASDGAEALLLERNHAGPIHVLVTDVVVPGTSGPNLADRIRLVRPGTRTLYVSGYPLSGRADGLLESGRAILPKPFSAEELARAVRAALDQPSS